MSVQSSILNYQNQSIHSLIKNGEIFFRATQLAELLEYQNPHDAIKKHVDNDDLAKCEVIDSLGRKQKVNFVNESGMYSLILGSKQASAKKIKKWVTSEVLPTIRKTGSYSLTINTEQQQAIKQALNERVYRTGEHHQSVYQKLYEAFKIPRYQDLPASKFNDAIKFLGGVKNNNCVLISLDDLKRQYNYLASIQEYYNRVFEQYNNHLAEFVSKNIPHLHYNISTALGVIQFNTCKSIDLVKGRLGKPQRNRVINFEADIPYLD